MGKNLKKYESEKQSSREVGALPPTALSHHRAYRSVHGGF